MLLAIDTSQNLCSACLYDTSEEKFLFTRSDNIQKGHSEHLLPMLEAELKKANCSWHSITGLAVVRGPGSFTGLRVGLAVAKALVLTLNIPCAAVSTFEVLAFTKKNNGEDIVCEVKVGNKVWQQNFKDGKSLCRPYLAENKKINKAALDIKQVALLAKTLPPSKTIEALYLSEPV